ncbi:MAG: type II CRISPR-associated endonuclease Cas1 [Armatimonadota bacterium]
MAWRTIVISNPARLRLENDQLKIMQEMEVTLPVDDINVLMIESQEVLITAALLARLAEAGVLVLICDRKHLPCFAGLPYANHSRLTGIHRMQLDMSVSLKRRFWQVIVTQKIKNQARCIELCGKTGYEALYNLAKEVDSGDAGNIEAYAAREYFKCLFGNGFYRQETNHINSALNYGYAILRGSIARALAQYGFILTQGLHHHSELNAFNLADDFIEPLRPLCDLKVCSMSFEDGFTAKHRHELVSLLTCDLVIDGLKQSVRRTCEIMASSFHTACREKNQKFLKMPMLMEIQEHRYE